MNRRTLVGTLFAGLVAVPPACDAPAGPEPQRPAAPRASTPPVAPTSPLAPTPPPNPSHRVVYTWDVSRPLNAEEAGLVALSWTDPATGRHEQTDPLGPALRFPYSKRFDVTDLQADRGHLAAAAIVDTPGVTVGCAISVDGRQVAANTGSRAVTGQDGEVQTSGETLCTPGA